MTTPSGGPEPTGYRPATSPYPSSQAEPPLDPSATPATPPGFLPPGAPGGGASYPGTPYPYPQQGQSCPQQGQSYPQQGQPYPQAYPSQTYPSQAQPYPGAPGSAQDPGVPEPWPAADTQRPLPPPPTEVTWSTEHPPPDSALGVAAAEQLGGWVGSVPIRLAKSWKVVWVSAVMGALGVVGVVAGASLEGGGGVALLIIAGIVGLFALLVMGTTIADMVRGRGRAAHLFEQGMALPDGKDSWYGVPWVTGLVGTIGGIYDADGRLSGNPEIDWRIGVAGRDPYITMLEVDDDLGALYQYALRCAVARQYDLAIADLRHGRSVAIGDVTISAGGYTGKKSSGLWDGVTRVAWNPEKTRIELDRMRNGAFETVAVTDVTDDLPNLELTVALMRSAAHLSTMR